MVSCLMATPEEAGTIVQLCCKERDQVCGWLVTGEMWWFCKLSTKLKTVRTLHVSVTFTVVTGRAGEGTEIL